MCASLPSTSSQAFPRAVLMGREGPVIPAATLEVLLSGGRPIELSYAGYPLEPLLRHGSAIEVDPKGVATKGDLVLCRAGRRADVRRVVSVADDGSLVTALDALPGGRERIERRALLGVLRGARSSGGRLGRMVVGAYPVWARVAQAACRLRCSVDTSGSGALDCESVRDKYEQQVAGYRSQIDRVPDRQSIDELCRSLSPGARILVAGSGAGSEVLELVRQGYRVTGIDVSAGMVQSCRETIEGEGLAAQILHANLYQLDLGDRVFEAVYFTPSVYSFLPGWSRRVRALEHLGRHLVPGGLAMLSFQRVRTISRMIDLVAYWLISRIRGLETEPGDWYTMFLTPQGSIGRSFTHLFRPETVVRELRLAGFRSVMPIGPAQILASRFDRAALEL